MDTVKCLIWDLDQTLWRGILLEDGTVTLPDGIRDMVIELDNRGILQSVASRNDHDQAWRWLEKFGLADYFVLPHIGWGRKPDSVRAIADKLQFAHRVVAFIDDQPAELAEMAHHLPEIRCYSADGALGLLSRPEFTPARVTTDARQRRSMYQAAFKRDAEWAGYAGADEDFLRTLELRLDIRRATGKDLARVEELTLRTSQMNATGVHYSEDALRALLSDERHEVLVTTLDDRFGPHGAVGIILLAKDPKVWHVKLLATSCRVVSFGAGTVLLRWLTDAAAAACVHLVADFRRTDRNRMMEVAYRFAGFADSTCDTCPAPPGVDIELLHLAPARQEAPTTMRVRGPVLTGPAATLVEWTGEAR
jgi:methoxymalonate biosynthesis protein